MSEYKITKQQRAYLESLICQRISRAATNKQFIEPKIRELRDLVGCEYIYLFAADDDRAGKLCSLYQDLGFDFRDEIYVTKPAYDFCCYFMCQEVRRLRTRKKEFLKNYNKPEEKAEAPAAV